MIAERLKESKGFFEIKRELSSASLSHAYLIVSDDKMLREAASSLIAGLIMCPNGGCGECAVCEKISSNSHADLKFYNKDGKMKVSDAETLIEDTYIKGWESSTKLYFIDNANMLSPQVQNKLLKIFEEPPKGVSIFLLSQSESGVLQTIASRAKKLYLPAFTPQDVLEELMEEGIDKQTAETAAVFSGGSFEKAFRYTGEGNYSEIYTGAFDVLIKCKRSSDIGLFMGNSIFSKENIVITLEFFEIILRDVLEYVSGGNSYKTINRDYDIKAIASGFTPGGAAIALMATVNAKKMLSSNVSVTAVAEKILFDILEAKYKWQQ